MLKSRTVLLIADSPADSDILCAALTSRRATPIVVEDHNKALDILRTHPVDLVLVDMDLETGLSVCRDIRSCWDVPVIVLAECDSNRDKVDALNGGADDFLAKPFSLDELIARICANLRRTTFAMHQTSKRDLIRLPCGHYQTPDEILRMAERIAVDRRGAAAVAGQSGKGRPRKIAMCRKCGESGGTLEMRGHKCVTEGTASTNAASPNLSSA